MVNAYIIGSHNIDSLDYESGISDDDSKQLSKIRPKDDRLHCNDAINLIGPKWNSKFENVLNWGVAVEDEHLPRNYYVKGPVRPLADFDFCYGMALVSEAFKNIVEGLEPGVHQFFDVALRWQDGALEQKRFYWFNICNGLDAVSETHSELPERRVVFSPVYNQDVKLTWRPRIRGGGRHKVVFDKDILGAAHIWRDNYLAIGSWCSEELRAQCQGAEITGIVFNEANAYEVK